MLSIVSYIYELYAVVFVQMVVWNRKWSFGTRFAIFHVSQLTVLFIT